MKKNDYLTAFLKNVPVLYANQGEAGDTFLKKGSGDVLLTYESFALGVAGAPESTVELVVPPRTVEITLPVAIARKNTERHKTTQLAQAYLNGLYSSEAQELFVKHRFRPRSKAVALKSASRFPATRIVRARDIFSADTESKHLSDGGTFDNLRSTPAKP